MCPIKKLLQTITLVCLMGLASTPAFALPNFSLIILNIDPLAQNHFVGDDVVIDLAISGLEFEDLSTFDLDLIYDDSILAFNGYTLGEELGVVDVDALDFSWGDLGGGLINLAELSLLQDLGTQSDEFSLVTLSFTGIDVGVAELFAENYILGDANGDPLDVLATVPGFVQINPVPVPPAAWLLGSGLIGLVSLRRRSLS